MSLRVQTKIVKNYVTSNKNVQLVDVKVHYMNKMVDVIVNLHQILQNLLRRMLLQRLLPRRLLSRRLLLRGQLLLQRLLPRRLLMRGMLLRGLLLRIGWRQIAQLQLPRRLLLRLD